MQLDRLPQLGIERLQRLSLGQGLLGLVAEIPVPPQGDAAIGRLEHVSGGKLVHSGEHRPVVGDDSQGQVFVKGDGVHDAELGRRGEDRLDLGAAVEPLAHASPEHRLLAQVVSRDQEAPTPPVPDGEGEHAPQLANQLRPVLLVEVHQDLGVAAGPESMTAGQQPLPQWLIVVDLAVQDDPERFVLVGNRLPSPREVDDGEAAETEPEARLDVDRGIVGATVRDCPRHGLDVGSCYAPRVKDPDKAAH